MIEVQEPFEPLYDNEDKFIILVTGGRGGAKSFNVSTFLERLSFEEGHIILFSRYTLTSAEVSVIPEFNEKIKLEGASEFFKITQKDIINKYSDSKVMFRGIKTSSGNQTANLKSIQGLTTFVCDEAEEWTSENDFDKIVLSIRKKGIQNRVIIVMNPTDINHFIYEKYIKNTHKIVEIDGVDVQISTHTSVLHIHTTYLDNLEYLSDEFMSEVTSLKEKAIKDSSDKSGKIDKHKFNKTKYARVIVGRWSEMLEGVIFTSYEVVPNIPSWVKKRGIGLDFGYTIDPSAAIQCAYDPEKNDLYLDELFYKTGMLTRDIVKGLKDFDDLKVMSESADPRLIQEIKNAGINIYPVDKYPGSVKAGIDKMLEMNLKITERSHHILEERKHYTWDQDKDGKFINEPIDDWNHAFDGARYWVLGALLGKILKPRDTKELENILY